MYTKEYLEGNIEEVFDSMGNEYYRSNNDWYWRYHAYCSQLAAEKGVPTACVASIFAAMSPQVSIHGNKIFVEAYFRGVKKHTKVLMDKADRLAALYGIERNEETRIQEACNILRGRKISNFFLSLNNPLHPTACCLDRHSLWVAGVLKTTVTPKQYDLIHEAYINVSQRLVMLPSQLQCSTWSYVRQIKFGNKYGV